MSLESRLIDFSGRVAEEVNSNKSFTFFSWTPGTYEVPIPVGGSIEGWVVGGGGAGGTPPAGGNQGGGSGAGGNWAPFAIPAESLNYLLDSNRLITVTIPSPSVVGSGGGATLLSTPNAQLVWMQTSPNASGVTGQTAGSGTRSFVAGQNGRNGGNAAAGAGGSIDAIGTAGGAGGGRSGSTTAFAGGANTVGLVNGLGAPFRQAVFSTTPIGQSGSSFSDVVNPALLVAGMPAPISGAGGGGSTDGAGGNGGAGGPGCGGGGGGAGVTGGVGGAGGPGIVYFRVYGPNA